MSFFSNLLFGSDPKTEQINRLNPGQDEFLNNLLAGLQGSGPLAGLFGVDPQFFQESFVDPAMNLFENRIAPGIQQKFIAAGAGRGSNVQDQLTRAGADVQGQLNQTLAGLINQAQNRALQGGQLALGTQAFQNVQQPGQTGLIPDVLSGIGAGFAQPFGQALGNFSSNLFNRRSQGATRRGQLQ